MRKETPAETETRRWIAEVVATHREQRVALDLPTIPDAFNADLLRWHLKEGLCWRQISRRLLSQMTLKADHGSVGRRLKRLRAMLVALRRQRENEDLLAAGKALFEGQGQST